VGGQECRGLGHAPGHRPVVRGHEPDETTRTVRAARTARTWLLYLAAASVAFDACWIGLHQVVTVRADAGTLCYDGFHPSADGYRVWAHALYPAVAKAAMQGV